MQSIIQLTLNFLPRPLLGFGLSLANAFMFTLSNVLVKQASNLDTFSICIFRFGYIVLHALPVNVYYGYDLFPRGNCTVSRIRFLPSSVNSCAEFLCLFHNSSM